MAVNDERSNIANLFHQIERSTLTAADSRRFVQRKSLDDILTKEAIKRAVKELHCQDYERAYLADEIYKEYRKVFAILICMRLEDDIVGFRQHKFSDERLPLDEGSMKKVIPNQVTSFVKHHQWIFLPHFFLANSRSYCHQDISTAQTILPFTKEVIRDDIQGEFGEISVVTIPMLSQEFQTSQATTITMIRKRIRRHARVSDGKHQEAFKKELRMFSLLRPLEHPNVVRLFASYTYNNEHNFLFPRLEMNLKQFFKLEERFGEFRWNSTFHLAIYGLASALESIHNFRSDALKHGLDLKAIGYHHDFRPANILVTEKTFVLTDFSLGGMKSHGTKSDTVWFPAPGDYLAPECQDEDFNPQVVSREIDVWAFGCLVADVLTYMYQGPQGVQAFHRSRRARSPYKESWESTSFYLSKDKLKPSVLKWLDELRTEKTKENIDVTLLALQTDSKERACISEIRSKLAVSAVRTLINQILAILESGLSTMKDAQRLSMKMWWAHMQIYVLRYAFSVDFDEERHFCRNLNAFDRYSAVLIELLHEVDLEFNPQTAGYRVKDGRDDTFEDRAERLTQRLTSQLPKELRQRAEAKWFASMSTEASQPNLIKPYYPLSHEERDKTSNSNRERMRNVLVQMAQNLEADAKEFYHNPRDLKYVETKGGHEYGFFKEQRVLVESLFWKSDERAVSPEERIRIMQLRAKSFNTESKPRKLNILKCLGFVDEVEREDGRDSYSFMYELPVEVDLMDFGGMTTLSAVLNRTCNNTAMMPDLQGKFQLAYALASFFQEFHRLKCLHENFNTRNVVFAYDPISRYGSFDEPTYHGASPWSKPYVIGLQKCRPDGQEWSTEGPADRSMLRKQEEHPNYRGRERFLMEYDYYSLGVVLLQIGSWTPLEQMPKLNISELRQQPKHRYFRKLRVPVGQKYADVVRACLDGTLDRENDFSLAEQNKAVFEKFMNKVVIPLEKLSSLQI